MTATSIGTKLGFGKITARIGAEVTGVSPSLELDPDTVAAIRVALSERRAVFTSTRYETVHPVVRVHPLTGERGHSVTGDASHYSPVADVQAA